MEFPLTVAAVMTPHPISVTPETDFTDIATLFARERISTVPVIDGDGIPVGVVSQADLPVTEHDRAGPARWMHWRAVPFVTNPTAATAETGVYGQVGCGPCPPTSARIGNSRHRKWSPRYASARCARDLMTARAPTVDVETSVAEAARELAAKELRRVFVVDDEGRLVGVVARPDLLDVYFRSDENVQRDIEDEVFGRVLRADPASFKVGVEHGVVTVLGRLDRRSAVSSAERLIPLIPGVVRLCSRLEYGWDDERP